MTPFLRSLLVFCIAAEVAIMALACNDSDPEVIAPADGNTNAVPDIVQDDDDEDVDPGYDSVTGSWHCRLQVYANVDGASIIDETVDLQLNQNNGNITGMLDELPITGTKSGRTLDLVATGDNAVFYLRGECNDSLTEIIGGDLAFQAPPGSSQGYGNWRAWR